MTSLADRTIAALRAERDTTASVAADLTEDRLTGPSAATRWSLAHVLSHLGSGSEITLAQLRAALDGADQPGQDFDSSVWDRWNAWGPVEQRDAYLEHSAAMVSAFEALDADQRERVRVPRPFAPAPVPVVAFAGMRLSEAALHGWDVRVPLTPTAGLADESAQVLIELFDGPLGFMLAFIGRADRIAGGPVVLDLAGSGFGVAIRDSVTLVSPVQNPTATFTGPLEAAIRLFAGRLGPEYTPAEVQVTGNVTIDQLRAVFPGY
jgi:uncharacterized protein (TIGR03083 family)